MTTTRVLRVSALLTLSALLGACTPPTVPPVNDGTPPTVSLVSLSSPVTKAGTVTVQANAQDDVAVKTVHFYLDGQTQPFHSDSSAPYEASLSWEAAQNGEHTLKVVAVDTSGNISAPVSAVINVNIPVPDTQTPSVSLSGPISAVTTASTAQYSASASDNVGVVRVEFYDNGVLLGTLNAAPYILNRAYTSADNGEHTLRAVAYDAAGNQAESSVKTTVNIPVTSTPGTDQTPPTVKITVPTTTITVAGPYKISVATADNVAVTRLEAVVVTPLGEVPLTLGAAGGSQTIDVTRFYNGTFTLRATAYDAAGNSSTDMVTVTVAIP